MAAKRSLRDLKRRAPNKLPRLRVVLVCEGEKTERIYFSLYTDQLQAANVKLEVMERKCGSDPLSVVSYGQEIFEADAGIDTCFCVIDRDTHTTFDAAIQLARAVTKKARNGRRFREIVSYPCFEIWFILHFGSCRKPFSRTGKKSAGDNAVSELRGFLPNYEKANLPAIRSLIDKTGKAIQNAASGRKDALESGELNPSTEVHLLIGYMLAAKVGNIPPEIVEALWPGSN